MLLRELFTRWMPASSKPFVLDQFRPWLERASTNLSNCNGEMGAGSSNITLYVVWPYVLALWVAHTLQQMTGLLSEGKTRRENRESKTMVVGCDRKNNG